MDVSTSSGTEQKLETLRSSAAETAVCSAQAGCERVAHVEGVGPDRTLGVGRGQREGEARVLDLVDHRPGRRRSAAAPHAVALGAGHSTSASWYALLKHGDLLGALGLGRAYLLKEALAWLLDLPSVELASEKLDE